MILSRRQHRTIGVDAKVSLSNKISRATTLFEQQQLVRFELVARDNIRPPSTTSGAEPTEVSCSM